MERLRKTREGLKAFSPYAYIPILIIGSFGAYFALQNFRLQKNGNRPEMIFTNVVLINPYHEGILEFTMRNVGTRTAYDLLVPVRTVEVSSGHMETLETIETSNAIRRDGTVGGQPRIDMRKFLDVMALCPKYRDEDSNKYEDVVFYRFPTVTPGLTKDKGGGGQYQPHDVSSDERRKLEKVRVCQD
jgi:hypothetical protein